LQALDRQTGAPRFDDALSTLLQRNLEYSFECRQRIALIYRNRRFCAGQQRRWKAQIFIYTTSSLIRGRARFRNPMRTRRTQTERWMFSADQPWGICLSLLLNKTARSRWGF